MDKRQRWLIILVVLGAMLLSPTRAAACTPSRQIIRVQENAISFGEIDKLSETVLVIYAPKPLLLDRNYNRYSRPATAIMISTNGLSTQDFSPHNLGDCGDIGKYAAIAEIDNREWVSVDLRSPFTGYLFANIAAVILGVAALLLARLWLTRKRESL